MILETFENESGFNARLVKNAEVLVEMVFTSKTARAKAVKALIKAFEPFNVVVEQVAA